MIAHDFNNIIAAVRGIAEFLEEDLAADAEKIAMVKRILSATQYADNLIKQILDYGNEQKFNKNVVSVIPLLEDCVDMLAPMLHSGASIEFSPPEDLYWVEGNENRLVQLFSNLLTNANRSLIHATREIQLTINSYGQFDLEQWQSNHPRFSANLPLAQTILGTTQFAQDCIVITLEDTGDGMHQGTMDKIFDLYFTTKQEAQTGGVGMSSVAEVIKECQAGIKIFSQKLIGTQVVVVLPLIVAEELTLNKMQ